MVMGEGTLLRDRLVQPWFDSHGLVRVVFALTKLNEDLSTSGDMLVADKRDAEAVLESLSRLRSQLPPRIMLEVKLERRNERGQETLLHSSESVRAGSTVTFQDTAKQRILRDYDVEIAQSATLANPVVGDLLTGACLAVRCRVVPGKGELLIESFARVAADAKAPPIKTLHDGIGPIDRAAREVDECGVAMRVPRGASRSVEWTGANGSRLRLTCSASWQDPPAQTGKRAIVRCRGLFQKGVAEFRTDHLEPDEGPAAFAAEAAFHRAGAEDVRVIGGEESAALAIVVSGEKAEQIDADVTSGLVRSLASAALEISVYDVAEGVGTVAAGTEATAIAHIQGHAIVGKAIAFSGRTEMRYIDDWDVEVAQSSRIPDPKVYVLRHGYHVDARVLADSQGGLEAVALDASVTRLARIDVKEATISREMKAGGTADTTGTITPAIVLPKDLVAIESPVLQTHAVSTVLQLDNEGAAILRRAAPRLLGKGRDLLVIVRVKR